MSFSVNTNNLTQIKTVPISFVIGKDENGKDKIVTIDAPIGSSILEIAHQNDLPLEGACEGSLACSTCHVVIDDASYNNLKPASDEENDMLDLAFGLTKTSRLGCQIIVTEGMKNMTIKIPSQTRNL